MASQVEFKFRYQEVLTAKEQRYEACKKSVFQIFNWMAVSLIICASFFTGVSQTDISTWNMTRYCNDEKFNRSVTTLSKSWAILIILTLACVSSAMATIKMVIFNTITKDIMNLVHYFMGFLLAWDVTYILQTIVSYPIPSFYKNDRLRDHYCSTNPFNVTKLNSKLLELDRDSRGSFPSFYMCALTYTTTHFFLFLYYTDNAKSFAAKTVFLMIPGLISCSYGVLLWRTNNNHPEDIVGGCFVGMLVAYFVANDLIASHRNHHFRDHFVSVILSREIEMGRFAPSQISEASDRVVGNEYTINLYPNNGINEPAPPATPQLDQPPPYWSL